MIFEYWLLWTSFVVSFALGERNQQMGVEMPLITNGDVPLIAKLDTTILDRNIKDYINVTAEKKINDNIAELKKNILNEILSTKYPRDCEDIGATQSGVYRIYPSGTRGFSVFCDNQHENGGWVVLQRRKNGSENFYRDWSDYKDGFGDLNEEFWLGNIKIHEITNKDEYELYIQLGDFDGQKRYARYQTFFVGDPASKYVLSIGDFSGDAGDAMSLHNGKTFATKDRDTSTNSCAKIHKGGWWYGTCHDANLNGLYLRGTHSAPANGINWYQWRGHRYSLKKTQMMLRRRR